MRRASVICVLFCLHACGSKEQTSNELQFSKAQVVQAIDDAGETAAGVVSALANVMTLEANGDLVGLKMRIDDVDALAQIISSELSVYVDGTEPSSAEIEVAVQSGEAPLSFTEAEGDISSRSTNGSIVWSVQNATEGWIQSPDVTLLLQQLVDDEAWSKGNAVVFTLTATSSAVAPGDEEAELSGLTLRQFEYDEAASFAAYLDITFRETKE